jgi:hypothetical protein
MASFDRATKRRAGAVTLVLSVAVAAACGSAGGSAVFLDDSNDAGASHDGGPVPVLSNTGDAANANPHPEAKSIAFDPPAQTLTVDGVTPATASYTLIATLQDGSTEAVTADSIEFDRPDLATATPGATVALTTTGAYAGTGTLHAVYGTNTATATLTVIIHASSNNGVPTTVTGALDGATTVDPSLSSLLYPYDQTVWPLGLTAPLAMWNAPNASGDTYRLHLAQSNYTYDVYTPVGQPGQLRVDQTTWDRMTASNPGGAATPITVMLSRWDGTNAYVSATITLTIAPASLRGAIYYWTASQNAQGVRSGHITQFRPGTGAAPVILNAGRCMGCHAVSADGTTLVADVDDNDEGVADASDRVPSIAPYGNWSNTRAWSSFDLTADAGAPQIKQTTMFGADIALSPDAKYVVFGGPTNPSVVGSKYMSLGDPKTGAVYPDSGLDQVNPIDAGTTLMEPAFAPDGTKLALVVGGGNLADNVIPSAPESIGYLDFSEDAGTFAPSLHTLVQATNPIFGSKQGLGYPSFTPDSQAIAFHAGTTSTGCTGTCDDTAYDDGQLWLLPLTSSTPILLNAASNPPLVTDQGVSVEPTFNPVARGGYSWVVFTSMRDWGNELTGVSSDAGQRQNAMRRLWVAAIDTTTGALDPSHPAIYLEGQEDTPNMRGFWALASCTSTVPAGTSGGACGAGFECCSGFCEKGQCVDVSQIACVGIGGACGTSSDCCNAGAVSCTNGVCATPLPK